MHSSLSFFYHFEIHARAFAASCEPTFLTRYSRTRSLQKCRNHVTRYCKRYNSARIRVYAFATKQNYTAVRWLGVSSTSHLINMRWTEWRRNRRESESEFSCPFIRRTWSHVDSWKCVCLLRENWDRYLFHSVIV